jgi:hypothetical protein
MPRNLTILVCGMMSPELRQGGAAWAVLQYILGLRRLGHEVVYIELLPKAPEGGGAFDLARSGNAACFAKVMRDFDFEHRSALLLAGTEQTSGLSYAGLRGIARGADVLINISGMLTDPALLEPVPHRVYLDLDPAFIQLWHAVCGIDMRFGAHTHFVTIGQAIGKAGCAVPTCGREWIPTLQPVVLDEWPVAGRITHDALTSIANFRGYGSIEHDGVFYGQKAHSLRDFFPLPTRTREKFELALSIHPDEKADLDALAANGWRLLDPAEVAGTPGSYREFIQGSKAEFGIAKSGYVHSRCGWFSDRSVCYLASGRPVIAQDTGFSEFVPAGEGLFAFATQDDVLGAIDAVNADYGRHSRAARRLAERWFDSDKVLASLLERIEAGP